MNFEKSNKNISFCIENCLFHTLNITHYHFENSLPDHSHGSNTYEIHYIANGYGKLKIGDTYYDLKPNTLYVNGPHVVHSQIPLKEDPMSEYCIFIKMDDSKIPISKSSPDSIVHLLRQYPFWIGEANPIIPPIMHGIFCELEHQYLGYEENMKALLSMLVTSTVRNFKEAQKPVMPFLKNTHIDTKPVIIDDYFLREYKTLSLENLANRLGLSPRQTERYLKEHYGKTFIQKKNESKMSTAALMLVDTQDSITDISDALGYSSIEHFSTAFKRYYKMSPSEYRKKCM